MKNRSRARLYKRAARKWSKYGSRNPVFAYQKPHKRWGRRLKLPHAAPATGENRTGFGFSPVYIKTYERKTIKKTQRLRFAGRSKNRTGPPRAVAYFAGFRPIPARLCAGRPLRDSLSLRAKKFGAFSAGGNRRSRPSRLRTNAGGIFVRSEGGTTTGKPTK